MAKNDIKRYRDNWQGEVDGAAQYRALAKAEKNPQLSQVYTNLARVYGVPTKRLNEQVRRNKDRFPSDFVFQLNQTETTLLMRSQIATASKRNIRHRPFVFTAHGAIMAANFFEQQNKKALEDGLQSLPVTIFAASPAEWQKASETRNANNYKSFNPRLRKVILPSP